MLRRVLPSVFRVAAILGEWLDVRGERVLQVPKIEASD